MSSQPIKSKYAGILNALSEMGESFAYKLRWSTIREAEHTILQLERKLSDKTAEAKGLLEKIEWMQREGTLHDCRDGSMKFTVYTPTASDLETGVYLAIQEELVAPRKKEGNG